MFPGHPIDSTGGGNGRRRPFRVYHNRPRPRGRVYDTGTSRTEKITSGRRQELTETLRRGPGRDSDEHRPYGLEGKIQEEGGGTPGLPTDESKNVETLNSVAHSDLPRHGDPCTRTHLLLVRPLLVRHWQVHVTECGP